MNQQIRFKYKDKDFYFNAKDIILPFKNNITLEEYLQEQERLNKSDNQPDWNNGDFQSPAFIKNKPFNKIIHSIDEAKSNNDVIDAIAIKKILDGFAYELHKTSAFIPGYDKAPSWQEVTLADLQTLLSQHYAGTIDLSTVWNIGDIKTINDISYVILDFNKDSLSSPQGVRNEAAITIGLFTDDLHMVTNVDTNDFFNNLIIDSHLLQLSDIGLPIETGVEYNGYAAYNPQHFKIPYKRTFPRLDSSVAPENAKTSGIIIADLTPVEHNGIGLIDCGAFYDRNGAYAYRTSLEKHTYLWNSSSGSTKDNFHNWVIYCGPQYGWRQTCHSSDINMNKQYQLVFSI